MPDDYTPSMTIGKSLEGNRRTHRMCYRGVGVALRMPSATSIKRYATSEVSATLTFRSRPATPAAASPAGCG